MINKYYKDFYGATASIQFVNDGVRLIINTSGKVTYDKVVKNERSAKMIMSKYSDGTMKEITK